MDGKDLKHLRIHLLNQGLKQFAEHIGELPSDYCEMETGKKFPSLNVLIIYSKLQELKESTDQLDHHQSYVAIQGFLLGIRVT